MTQRPAIFKWRHFAPEVILCAVRWCLRYSLSYRDVHELLVERGLESTIRRSGDRFSATRRNWMSELDPT
jgi:transposase-like protein